LKNITEADFLIQSGPVSEDDKRLLSDFIRSYKKKASSRAPRKSPRRRTK